MSKLKDYAIVHALVIEYPEHADRGAALEKKVHEAIADEWEPIGGLVVDGEGNMYQSMVWKPTIKFSTSNGLVNKWGSDIETIAEVI